MKQLLRVALRLQRMYRGAQARLAVAKLRETRRVAAARIQAGRRPGWQTQQPCCKGPATADPVTADPATADPATAGDPATADPVTADPVCLLHNP